MGMAADVYTQMKEIRDEVMKLTSSPLYTYRTEHNYRPVLGEGSHDADIVFIGEAPGKNEALQGRPFCGAAGRVLDDLLTGIGVDRQTVYITNIVKDRPPDNRDPTPAEVACYAPFLERQLAVIRPKVIVTLGRHAMNHIMRQYDLEFDIEPIGSAHGNVYKATAPFGPIQIIPQYHPAAAIYNRDLIETLKKDFAVIPTLV